MCHVFYSSVVGVQRKSAGWDHKIPRSIYHTLYSTDMFAKWPPPVSLYLGPYSLNRTTSLFLHTSTAVPAPHSTDGNEKRHKCSKCSVFLRWASLLKYVLLCFSVGDDGQLLQLIHWVGYYVPYTTLTLRWIIKHKPLEENRCIGPVLFETCCCSFALIGLRLRRKKSPFPQRLM